MRYSFLIVSLFASKTAKSGTRVHWLKHYKIQINRNYHWIVSFECLRFHQFKYEILRLFLGDTNLRIAFTLIIASPTNNWPVISAAWSLYIFDISMGSLCSAPPFMLNPNPVFLSRRIWTMRSYNVDKIDVLIVCVLFIKTPDSREIKVFKLVNHKRNLLLLIRLVVRYCLSVWMYPFAVKLLVPLLVSNVWVLDYFFHR